jgi:hypothetical protein
LPRGGRRRRGRRGKGRPAAERQDSQKDEKSRVQQEGSAGTGKRRRRRRRGGRESGLASMIHRPSKLETLPPDGLVLEELISNLQEEYGTPVTPQEFRLTIKMSPADEASGQSESDERETTSGRLDGGRRRRRRPRTPGAEVTQITAEPEDPEDPQEIPPS